MVRFYTPNLDEACDALNLYDIDYDLDDGDRIMVDDSFYDDNGVRGNRSCRSPRLINRAYGLPRKPRL